MTKHGHGKGEEVEAGQGLREAFVVARQATEPGRPT